MPAKSDAQAGFAGMSMSEEGRKKLRASGKKPMPKKVAEDYVRVAKKDPPQRVSRHKPVRKPTARYQRVR